MNIDATIGELYYRSERLHKLRRDLQSVGPGICKAIGFSRAATRNSNRGHKSGRGEQIKFGFQQDLENSTNIKLLSYFLYRFFTILGA